MLLTIQCISQGLILMISYSIEILQAVINFLKLKPYFLIIFNKIKYLEMNKDAKFNMTYYQFVYPELPVIQ